MSCAYKDIFGKPGTGAHSYRFMGFAIVDVALTVLVAMLTAWAFGIPLVWSLVGWFLAGIFLHWLFCVRTTVDKLIFGLGEP